MISYGLYKISTNAPPNETLLYSLAARFTIKLMMFMVVEMIVMITQIRQLRWSLCKK